MVNALRGEQPSFLDSDDAIRPGHEAAKLLAPVVSAAESVESLLAALRREEVAPAAVDVVVARLRSDVHADQSWRQAVAQNAERARRLVAARALTEAALGSSDQGLALPLSSLGPLWGHDVDVLVDDRGLRSACLSLASAGFADVNPLLRRLARTTPGVRRFGAVRGGEILASVELCTTLHPLGPSARAPVARAAPTGGLPRLIPADQLLRRCLKIAAARRVSLRSLLELLALLEAISTLPESREICVALRRCARREQLVAGPGTLTAAAQSTPARVNWIYARARAYGLRREARHRIRPRRVRVAFSGIDGAGKSTQAALLAERLRRLDVPAGVVWARLGFSGSAVVARVVSALQRTLPAGSHSAQTARAAGATERDPATRRGALGWAWALVVTLDYILQLRRGTRVLRGAVVIHDRGLADAVIGLELGYAGSLRLGTHRRLIAWLVPDPDRTFYLRLPADAAKARKDDIFATEVLERHVQRYERLSTHPEAVITLDGVDQPEAIAQRVLAILLASPECARGA